jgi:hypothetical protein
MLISCISMLIKLVLLLKPYLRLLLNLLLPHIFFVQDSSVTGLFQVSFNVFDSLGNKIPSLSSYQTSSVFNKPVYL